MTRMKHRLIRGLAALAMVAAATAPGLAGGLSGDVARQAMCDEYLVWCVVQAIDDPICDTAPESAACIRARITRDAVCQERYDLCLHRESDEDT